MSKAHSRLTRILQTFEDIEFVLQHSGSGSPSAVQQSVIKPALRMHIINIAEQFSRLKDENEFQILARFDSRDLRGIAAVRNFIAHDYDGVDDEIIDEVVHVNFPALKRTLERILEQ